MSLKKFSSILERYNEGTDSTFTHNGILYSVDSAIEQTKKQKAKDINIEDLSWILDHTNIDPARVDIVDINIPIIITEYNNTYYVLDGVHRLSKAIDENKKTIKAFTLTTDQLKKCIIEAHSYEIDINGNILTYDIISDLIEDIEENLKTYRPDVKFKINESGNNLVVTIDGSEKRYRINKVIKSNTLNLDTVESL